MHFLIPENSHQRLRMLEQPSLQTDDNKLESRTRLATDIIADLLDVIIVESSIDFVEDEEGRGLIGVDGEEEGESGHGLFSSGEMLHVAETLHRRHGVVLDAVEVGLVGVFHVEVSGTTDGEGGAAGELLVDTLDLLGDVVEGLLEEVESVGHISDGF